MSPTRWVGAALLTLSLAASVPAMTLEHLRCEDLADPLGIDVTTPRLSWILKSDQRGDRQTAYRVIVASRKDQLEQGKGDLWDSGQVKSDQSVFVPYGGTALASGTDCWWKVQVWDEAGKASAWSPAAHWSMGLLQPGDWTGRWIGLDQNEVPAPFTGSRWIWTDQTPPAPNVDQLTRYFRGVMEIPAGAAVRSGHLLVTVGNGVFVPSVNGFRMRIADTIVPGLAQDVDFTWRLKPGRNVVALMVQPEQSPGLPAAVAARLEVTLMDGRKLVLTTDEHWKVSAFPEPGWDMPDYAEKGWLAATPSVDVGGAPWGPQVRPNPRRLPARWLRREFAVDRPVRRAMVYASGEGVSDLFLNGKKVGDEWMGPGLSEIPERAYYKAYEVTDQLRSGANAVGVVLGNGRFYAPRRGAPFGEQYPKLMLKLVAEYQDGGQMTVVSDDQWKITDRGEIRTNNDYDGEEEDARMELRGWSEPGYAATGWQPAQLVGPAARHLAAAMFPPMRVTGTVHPVSVKQIGADTYVFDFGQNLVGHCVVRLNGPSGAEIKLRHAETVGPDGVPHFENLRTAMSLDSYILKGGGAEVFEPRFASHGFRFVEMNGFPGKPDLSVIDAKVVGDDLERVGQFASSNELLNQIYHNMEWGIRGNYHSIPTDCPQRDERQGWTGDRVYESKGEAFVFDTAPLYHKWFQDMADTQREDGSLSDVAPSYFPYFNQDVTWAGAFVLSPEALYEQFGDPTFFKLHYAEMKRWVTHMEGFTAQGGIIPNDRYGDWCPPPDVNLGLIHMQSPLANPSGAFMASTHFYVVLRMMEKYAQRLGREDDAAAYRAKAEQFKLAFNRRFLSADGRTYDTGGQTSYLLPLAFDLVPAEAREGMQHRLVDRIEHEDHDHVNLGLVGVQQLMRTLSDAGHADLAYKMATQTTYPSWGYMVKQGATTVWELWNGNTADVAMNSGNHVMLIGDCVIWLYENVAGIKADPAHPGFKHILMSPTPVGDLTSARGSYRSPYGLISSEWRKSASGLAWNVVVPANTTATLEIPAASAEQVTENGHALAQASGIKIAGQKDGRVELEVGSGSYHFMTLGSR